MGQTEIPQQIYIQGGVTELNCGLAHNCAIINFALLCWGSDVRLQSTGYTYDMNNLIKNSWIISLGTGDRHSCAYGINKDTGLPKLLCWGLNSDSQCNLPHKLIMTGRVNKTGEVLFALGGSHSCLVDIDKKLDCFGWNWYGQTNFEVIGNQ